ncbi:MAG: PHP domain-containing protein [Pelagibacteraceae bacterium]
MVSDYINLKVHTQFSICEGAVKISKLSTFCKENNISAVGICDKSNLSGALEFSQELIKQGIQPIIGTSIFLKEIIDRKEFFGTISLFAKNQIGYKNLLKLSSEAYLSLKNSEEHPSISLEFLKKFSDGLIILIGGSKSFFSDLLNLNKDKYCTDEIVKLKKIFNDNIYIEIQRHNEKHETDLEKKLLKLGSDLSIPLIATNEVFYLDQETFNAHDAYICVGEKTYVNEKNRLKYSNKHFFLKNDDFSNLFKDLPDALENNKNFKYRINFFPIKIKPLLPSFSENNEEIDNLLLEKAKNGLAERFQKFIYPNLNKNDSKEKITKIYEDRLNYEISVITKMKFSGYFLIVSDYIKWAKSNNIPVGPGRGSGAGSLVAWCLSITDIDPIRLGLIF